MNLMTTGRERQPWAKTNPGFDTKLRRLLADKKPIIGTFVQDTQSPFIMQVIANAGLQFAIIDMEHSTFDLPIVATLCQTARLCGLSPLVRVCDAEYHLICPVLDAGAVGIVLPRVQTAEQVKRVAPWLRFPPIGERGFGGARGHSYYRLAPGESLTSPAQFPVFAVMIETRQAFEQVDEIVSVPEVDAVFVGPRDTSVAVGCPNELTHPDVVAAAERVLKSALTHGKAMGYVSADLEVLQKWKDAGATLLCHGTETAHLAAAWRNGRETLGL
jgi:2-dehydro-3-deoxyglucarate aldolase/4-hydroxy-2-oxoheptanedioate aldolase